MDARTLQRRIKSWLGTPAGQATLALVLSRALSWGFALLGSGGHVQAAFAQWDSGHYLSIVEHGYPSKEAGDWAFYPLFPALARTVAIGAAISTAGFWAGLLLLHKLTDETIGRAAAKRTLWIAAFFPTSLYCSVYFPEGLYLFLTVGAFLAARRRRVAIAAFLGINAALDHGSSAMALIPGLLLISQRRIWERLVAAAGPAIGVLIFYLIAYHFSGHLLAPMHAERSWGREFRGTFFAIVPALRDAVAALEGQTPARWSFEAGWVRELELAVLVLIVAAMIWHLKNLQLAFAGYLFAFLALALSFYWPEHPLMSLLRFVAVLFPVYIYAGTCAQGRLLRAILIAEAFGLAALSWRFGHGYWIA